MVDDKVLFPDRREAIAGMLADAFRKSRIVGNKFEIGAVEAGELRQLVEGQHAVDHENFVVGDRERLLHETLQLRGSLRVDLQADHRPPAATLQSRLQKTNQ